VLTVAPLETEAHNEALSSPDHNEDLSFPENRLAMSLAEMCLSLVFCGREAWFAVEALDLDRLEAHAVTEPAQPPGV
jgi:hypothetical protein